MNNNILLFLIITLLLLLIPNVSFKINNIFNKVYWKNLSSSIIAISIGISPILYVGPIIAADDDLSLSLQEQIQTIAKKQVSEQQERIEKDELEALNRQIKYPEGKLIATGKIILGETNSNLPLGLVKPSLLNNEFDNDKSTLFLLAVGREGPPLAAKKLKVNDIEFPIVFEILDTDLIFPYTPDAWKNSANSKDTIAITALLSPTNLLATPNPSTKVGFGISQPLNIAGLLSRSPAKVVVKDNVDTTLYSQEEIKLLSGVDNELDRINKGQRK